ncbi:hypothetical protein BBK82_10760 [Lentzea guizhouensis]|uniref:Uncharacterized protein n=1 Tax=Lentzea guizhouensis TaxID=1586287 RepID=A0A1B2HFK0_9PSEU|nr:hypothetical protein [Lentzea guizhouensis]ANZ36476.1 hypothetical protein BBK82_10760 [Lentzea guizhouensis]
MSQRQRREATGTTQTGGKPGSAVMWRGKRFGLPAPQDYPLDAIEAEESGQTLTALRLILGDDQYSTFRTLARTTGDADDFSKAIMRELGRGNR